MINFLMKCLLTSTLLLNLNLLCLLFFALGCQFIISIKDYAWDFFLVLGRNTVASACYYFFLQRVASDEQLLVRPCEDCMNHVTHRRPKLYSSCVYIPIYKPLLWSMIFNLTEN